VLNASPVPSRTPALTIGVPVFNAERYLAEALDSLLSQTYRDFDLILCDNCSTDRTPEICRAYAARDPRVRCYRNDHNLGASGNFNAAFKLSSARYFKWAPYDDKLEPGFLAQCIEALEADPSVVLCYSKAMIIDENGAFEVNYDPGPDTSSPRPQERFRNLLMQPEYAIQLMGVIRSDAIRKTALLGSFPSCDEVFLAELSLLGRFHEVADRLYHYRRHSAQSTKQPKQRDRVAFFDTSLEGKIVLPTWRYLLASVRAVNRAPLGAVARSQCRLTTLRWAVRPDHFRALSMDLFLALSKLLHRALTRSFKLHPTALKSASSAQGARTNMR
jgi:glycosyltransferase involved in cell wall biosynthesis